jgi:hypothetical protein
MSSSLTSGASGKELGSTTPSVIAIVDYPLISIKGTYSASYSSKRFTFSLFTAIRSNNCLYSPVLS